jgi:hypothetical protein
MFSFAWTAIVQPVGDNDLKQFATVPSTRRKKKKIKKTNGTAFDYFAPII